MFNLSKRFHQNQLLALQCLLPNHTGFTTVVAYCNPTKTKSPSRTFLLLERQKRDKKNLHQSPRLPLNQSSLIQYYTQQACLKQL